jgi:hypothetical protein
MKTDKAFYLGLDAGAAEGDWTAESLFEKMPDGTMRLVECYRYRTTIDSTVVGPVVSSAQCEKP